MKQLATYCGLTVLVVLYASCLVPNPAYNLDDAPRSADPDASDLCGGMR